MIMEANNEAMDLDEAMDPDEYPDDYESCARCGYDHEYEPELALKAHLACKLCLAEMALGELGNGPDHDCHEHVR